jgi:hypothetical protein
MAGGELFYAQLLENRTTLLVLSAEMYLDQNAQFFDSRR